MPARSIDPLLRRFCAAALVVLGLLAYSNSFDVPFIFDDEYAIPENPQLASTSPWQWLVAPTQSAAAGRPVVSWSIALNYALGGLSVRGYHLFNLGIHLASGLLLWGIAWRTLASPRLAVTFGSRARWLAWAIAALWLLHPLQTEAVTYVIQRTELLMGLFYLLTLYAAIRSWEHGSGQRWRNISIAACALGMASKEVMVSAPLVVLLYDRAFFSGGWREAFRKRWKLYLALGASWLVLAGLMATGPRANSAGFGLGMSAGQYALTQCWAIARYLRLSFWPAGLCLDYGAKPVTDLQHCLPGAVLLIGLAAATVYVWMRGRQPWGFLGACFFLLLAPSSSVVPIVTEVAAERRMYLPLAAVIAAAVVAFAWAAGRALDTLAKRSRALAGDRPRLAAALVLAMVGALGTTTFARNGLYRTPVALWADTSAKAPANPRAQTSLGKALFEVGQFTAAEQAYRSALALDPGYAEAHNNLGAALAQQGRRDEAIEQYLTAIRLKPSYSSAYNNLAVAREQQGRRREADEAYRRALECDPGYVSAAMNYGIFLFRESRLTDAEKQFRCAIELRPKLAQPYSQLAAVLAAENRKEEAEASLHRAVELDPRFTDAWENLAKLLFERWQTSGEQSLLDRAFAAASNALRLAPRASSPHNTLAILLAATGRREQAVAQFRAALELDPGNAAAQRNLAALLTGR